MLSIAEKSIFILASLATLVAVIFAIKRLVRIISFGHGQIQWQIAWKRLINVLLRIVTFQPVFRLRLWPSIFHGLVGWGFGFYLLVNIVEVLKGFIPGFLIPGKIGNIYSLLADLFSVAVLTGMIFFVIRRFIFQPSNLTAREITLLNQTARHGIKQDSAIVAGFIILHVGGHFIGESFAIDLAGKPDPWQPFASLLSGAWSHFNLQSLILGQHIAFWLALGLIMVFFPYFPYSKHVHLFFAPLNFLLKPDRRSIGELSYINLDDTSIEQFGAARIGDLGWEQIMDAYACIMCFRCQEVCPAYATGKVLSPAALEINKRYYLNSVNSLEDSPLLIQTAISTEAIWACTSCGACLDICPVGNEPMRDILDIRRSLVLMENSFPKQLEVAFRGMERYSNPWGVPNSERMKWAEGIKVPTIEQNPVPEILWWVGCAPATDPHAQTTARAFARILNAAGLNFAVLGQAEECTGDSARRAGREDIFFALATVNVEMLNEIKPARIVTTCPHCLHALKNEYPAFGGNYTVIHHTQLIDELIDNGKIHLSQKTGDDDLQFPLSYHDPCYLGRHNLIYKEPRQLLKKVDTNLLEMPHHSAKSFCCGAGGAQMWKEEEHGAIRISSQRINEALDSGARTLSVACPFCMVMLKDTAKTEGKQIKIVDIAELIADRLD